MSWSRMRCINPGLRALVAVRKDRDRPRSVLQRQAPRPRPSGPSVTHSAAAFALAHNSVAMPAVDFPTGRIKYKARPRGMFSPSEASVAERTLHEQVCKRIKSLVRSAGKLSELPYKEVVLSCKVLYEGGGDEAWFFAHVASGNEATGLVPHRLCMAVLVPSMPRQVQEPLRGIELQYDYLEYVALQRSLPFFKPARDIGRLRHYCLSDFVAFIMAPALSGKATRITCRLVDLAKIGGDKFRLKDFVAEALMQADR